VQATHQRLPCVRAVHGPDAGDGDVGVRVAFANNAPALANAALTFHHTRWDMHTEQEAAGTADSQDAGAVDAAAVAAPTTVAEWTEAAEDQEGDELRKLRDKFRGLLTQVLLQILTRAFACGGCCADWNPAVRCLCVPRN
jgi:hypothetical protein